MGVETHGYTEKFAFVICSGNISKYDFIFSLSTSKGLLLQKSFLFTFAKVKVNLKRLKVLHNF